MKEEQEERTWDRLPTRRPCVPRSHLPTMGWKFHHVRNAVTGDGKLLSQGRENKTMKGFGLVSGKRLRTSQPPTDTRRECRVRGARPHLDADSAVTLSKDAAPRAQDAESGRVVASKSQESGPGSQSRAVRTGPEVGRWLCPRQPSVHREPLPWPEAEGRAEPPRQGLIDRKAEKKMQTGYPPTVSPGSPGEPPEHRAGSPKAQIRSRHLWAGGLGEAPHFSVPGPLHLSRKR